MLTINEEQHEAETASESIINQVLPTEHMQQATEATKNKDGYYKVDNAKKKVTSDIGDGEMLNEGTIETRDIIEGVSFGVIGEGDNN